MRKQCAERRSIPQHAATTAFSSSWNARLRSNKPIPSTSEDTTIKQIHRNQNRLLLEERMSCLNAETSPMPVTNVFLDHRDVPSRTPGFVLADNVSQSASQFSAFFWGDLCVKHWWQQLFTRRWTARPNDNATPLSRVFDTTFLSASITRMFSASHALTHRVSDFVVLTVCLYTDLSQSKTTWIFAVPSNNRCIDLRQVWVFFVVMVENTTVAHISVTNESRRKYVQVASAI